VAEVNGKQFSMSYFINDVKYQLTSYVNGDWSQASMYLDYLLQNIQDSELLRQEAAKLNITVSEDEIDTELKGNTGINDPALRDIARTQLLSQKMRDEYFKPQLPATAEQRQVLAMFLESPTQANQIQASIEAGADFGSLAGDLSLDSTTKDKKGDLGSHPREVFDGLTGSKVASDGIFNAPIGALNQVPDKDKTKQLGYWLVKVTERKADTGEAHVSGMLLSSEEEALNVKSRLDAGEDFTALAKEFSQTWTEENKDDFGWIPGDSTDAAAIYIFNEDIPLNTVSQPIKDTNASTKSGVWLIKVAALQNDQAISAEDQNTMIGQLFSDWLDKAKADPANKITSNLDDTRKTWVVDYLTKNAV
jgi:parvulin-like peptidyl-prolyl isomerase